MVALSSFVSLILKRFEDGRLFEILVYHKMVKMADLRW
jgi:hypothetical protein